MKMTVALLEQAGGSLDDMRAYELRKMVKDMYTSSATILPVHLSEVTGVAIGFKSASSLFWPIPQGYLDARIAADQDHREAWRAQTLLATLGDTFGDLLAQAGGVRFAVD